MGTNAAWLLFRVLTEADDRGASPRTMMILLGAYASRRDADAAMKKDMDACVRPSVVDAMGFLSVRLSYHFRKVPIEGTADDGSAQ